MGKKYFRWNDGCAPTENKNIVLSVILKNIKNKV